jgi:hypothetical protein
VWLPLPLFLVLTCAGLCPYRIIYELNAVDVVRQSVFNLRELLIGWPVSALSLCLDS